MPAQNCLEILVDLVPALPDDTTIVVYCEGGGCDSSEQVYETLKSFDFSRVRLFAGGWELWTRAGLPVEKGG